MTTESLSELSGAVTSSLHRFLDVYEPLRPDLYRYCRYLTRSPWDAEDLAQDTLARAFATLGRMVAGPPNPRAWLFRVASNLWIDQQRRTKAVPEVAEELHAREPRATREAAGTLLVRLSPQERAAVVLKDVFAWTLEEIAEALGTTPGTVKSALHRGRGKLVDPDPGEPAARPAPGVLDAFCAAFNAHDLDRLTSLMLDTSVIEVVGARTDYGVATSRILWGMLFGAQRMADPSVKGGVAVHLRAGVLATPPRAEIRYWRGEAVLLSWYAHGDGDAVRAITRLAPDAGGDHVAHLRNYFYTPDLLVDLCSDLTVPVRVNGYRYW